MIIPRKLRTSRRVTRLLAAVALALGTIGVGVLGASTASADTAAYTIVNGAPESLAPYSSSEVGFLGNSANVTIRCYLNGDSVTGPYGTETAWDMVVTASNSVALGGTFVPDAYIYTGSNSTVVPLCGFASGHTIGGGSVGVYTGPGTGYTQVNSLPSGTKLEIGCYALGTTVTGPYGADDIWDEISATYNSPEEWMPDALIYTGSNSAVVPHCQSS